MRLVVLEKSKEQGLSCWRRAPETMGMWYVSQVVSQKTQIFFLVYELLREA